MVEDNITPAAIRSHRARKRSAPLCSNDRAATVTGIVPSDTHPDAAGIQLEIFRRMTAEQRLRLAMEMSESIRQVALAGLRSRRPDLDPDGLSRELLHIMYGFTPER